MLAQLKQYDEQDLKAIYSKIKLFDDPKELKKVSAVVTQQRNSLSAINTYNNNILKLVNTSQLSKANARNESILERSKNVNDNSPNAISSKPTELLSSLQNLTKLIDSLSDKMKMTDLSGSSPLQMIPELGTGGKFAKNIGKAAAVLGAVAVGTAVISSVSRPDQTSDKLNRTTNSAIQKSDQRLEATKVSEQSFASQFASFMSSLFTGGLIGGAINAVSSALGGGNEDYSNLKPAGDSAHAGQAMKFFQSQGWTKEQAAGIVGNLQAESGANLNSNAVGDSGKAYGIGQWHADRQANFAKEFGKVAGSSFEDQLKFVQWELNHTESRAGKALKSAKTAQEAATIIDQLYERSAGTARGQRIANAIALAGGDYDKAASSSRNVNLGTSDAPKGTIWKNKDKSGLITFVSKTNDPRNGGIKYETWTNQDSTHYPISEEDAKAQIQTRGLKSNNTTSTKTSGTSLTNNEARGLLRFTSGSGDEAHFNRLNPETKKAILAAAAEYKQRTGNLLTISSGGRSDAEQKLLYDESVRAGRPGKTAQGRDVARPGYSNHGKGWAVDIGQKGDPVARSILEKHGMMWFGPNDDVHYTLNGHGEGGQMQQSNPRSQMPAASTKSAMNRAHTNRHAPTIIVRNHQITKTVKPPMFASQGSAPKQIIRPTTEYYDYLV